MPFPYTTEKAHTTGPITNTSGNAATQTGGAAILSTEGRQVIDVSDTIYFLNPTLNPFSTFLTSYGKEYNGETYEGVGMRTRSVQGPLFHCLTDQMPGRYASVSGTYGTGAVTVTVTGAGSTPARIFTVGDTVKNIRTGEVMLVATIAGDTTITLAATGRAFGTTAAAAGADGDQLVIIGNANEENSALRNANSTEVDEEYNYTLRALSALVA